MLLALRDYLAQEKCVSMAQLARVFQIDATALLPMLDVWVARGVIMKAYEAKSCASICKGCHPGAASYYTYML